MPFSVNIESRVPVFIVFVINLTSRDNIDSCKCSFHESNKIIYFLFKPFLRLCFQWRCVVRCDCDSDTDPDFAMLMARENVKNTNFAKHKLVFFFFF